MNIHIVDDDPWISDLLEYQLKLIDESCQIVKFNNGKNFLKQLPTKPQLILLDYSLPDIDGQQLLESIKKTSPDSIVIIISSSTDLNLAVALIKQGAFDYMLKDENIQDRLWINYRKIEQIMALNQEVADLKAEVESSKRNKQEIIGQSKSIQNLLPLLLKAATSQINVSIYGETGTGKEVVAKFIHENSPHSNAPFVAVNLGALPRELAESELFGHEKGAYTGAHERRIGKFELAAQGTLFLDEIGELDTSLQVKLLRVLQERSFTRIGGNKLIPVTCRIICATHKKLEEEVEAGRFREDLYYRLIGLNLVLEPLRNRGTDSLLLAEHFLKSHRTKTQQFVLSEAAKTKLLHYPYPGNIRELKAIIELATFLCNDTTIEEHHIQFRNRQSNWQLLDKQLSLSEINLQIIKHKLAEYNNDYQRVADELKIGKSTIYRLLKENNYKLNAQ